jgi:hypothetical protein
MGMRTPYTDHFNPRPCDCCGQAEVEGQWWFLNNYFGIRGYFCPNCYDKVCHGHNKLPDNPEQYQQVLIQQQLEQNR